MASIGWPLARYQYLHFPTLLFYWRGVPRPRPRSHSGLPLLLFPNPIRRRPPGGFPVDVPRFPDPFFTAVPFPLAGRPSLSSSIQVFLSCIDVPPLEVRALLTLSPTHLQSFEPWSDFGADTCRLSFGEFWKTSFVRSPCYRSSVFFSSDSSQPLPEFSSRFSACWSQRVVMRMARFGFHSLAC